jgi:hypothetical protein
VEKDITVGPGDAQKHNLILDAGGVRLASILAGNGTPTRLVQKPGGEGQCQRNLRLSAPHLSKV